MQSIPPLCSKSIYETRLTLMMSAIGGFLYLVSSERRHSLDRCLPRWHLTYVTSLYFATPTMARYNKRPAPVDACFLDDRDPKRARFGIPPFPDARATLPKSLHSSFSAQYALADVPSSGKGLEHPTASRIRPSEDEQDRDFSQADEDSEQRTKLTPVIQVRCRNLFSFSTHRSRLALKR